MSLSTAKLQTGILEDEKRIKQTVASLISQLKVQADLMLALSAYEFDDLYNQGGRIADQSHVVDITAAFQAEFVKLPAIVDTFTLITRGTCPTVAVTQSGGYVVITTTADTDRHNPRLLALNPRTGALVRIESFRGVSYAGAYDARVPSEWRNAEMFVDDAYGVVGAG